MNLERDYDINLLSPGLRGADRRSLLQSNALFLLVICLIVLGWIGIWGWYALRERAQKAEVTHLQNQLALVLVEEPETGTRAETLRTAVAMKEAKIREIEVDMILNSEILNQIETAIPPETSLAEISMSGDQLVCKGVTADYLGLARFITTANQQSLLNEARCVMAEPASSGVRFEIELRIAEE
ncbi:MAG: PilN domain-containing protein [Syntrophomonadales bacterium]|jgi:Tfp pilus assembly protein PilN